MYTDLTSELSGLPNYSVGGNSANYRLYGDQISLAGKPLSKPITIANVLSNAKINGPVNALTNTFESHSIDNMVSQIAANAQASPETSQGPNVLPIWETLGAVTATAISPTVVTLAVVVKATGTEQAFDPPSASDYVFTAKAGSPLFSCAILPNVNGVAAWNIRSHAGSKWSAFSKISIGGKHCFGAAGADAIEFQPLDVSGVNIDLPDSLLFLTSFNKAGTFTGTLSAFGVAAATIHR